MIKLGLNNLKDIKIGTAPVKKIMMGATLLWELLSDLLPHFVQRVAADGGTYVGNTEVDEDIVMDSNLTLLMKPVASKAGKLYSAIPTDGSGDFVVANGDEPTIEYDLVEDGTEVGPDKYGENLYPFNSTMGGITAYAGGSHFSFQSSSKTPPAGLEYAWTQATEYVGYWLIDNGYPTSGNSIYVRGYVTTDYDYTFVAKNGTSNTTRHSYNVVNVGGGWYEHTAHFDIGDKLNVDLFQNSVFHDFAGLQISTTLNGLDNYIETTGTAKPYGNYADTIQLYKNGNFRVKVQAMENIMPRLDSFNMGSSDMRVDTTTSYSGLLNDDVYRAYTTGSWTTADYIYYDLGSSMSGDYTIIQYCRSTSTSYGFVGVTTGISYTPFFRETRQSTESVGNGWYKVISTMTFSAGTNYYLQIRPATSTGYYYYITGAMLIEGVHTDNTTGTDDFFKGSKADEVSLTPPPGTNAIYTTVDGTTSKIETIPTTYSLPLGNVELVKMTKYSHNSIEWVIGTEVYDGEITTLEVNIN